MIDTGLSIKFIYTLKVLAVVTSTGLFVVLVDAFRRKNRKRLFIIFPVFMLFCTATILIFSLNLRSKEEVREYNKRKELSLTRGEKLIYFLERFSKKAGLFPAKLSILKSVYPAVKTKHGWGKPYNYTSNGITFRLSFSIPNDDGYYFYNSATGEQRYKGYLFKYMHGKIIR